MTKCIYANLETNEQNEDGVALTLYFDNLPNLEEIKTECERRTKNYKMSADVNDEFFGFEVCPNVISTMASLFRIQVHPTC